MVNFPIIIKNKIGSSIAFILFIYILINPSQVNAQVKDAAKSDTLQEIKVQAFIQNQTIKNLPAPVGLINNKLLRLFPPYTLISAANSIPGVRLEERSPGSFRINIRGSSLRSPFGVKNVKVYFNGIPVTDPSGLTYLNVFGPVQTGYIEIIKGPGSSLYGAGTGGVLLMKGQSQQPGIEAGITSGSYGLLQAYGALNYIHGNTMGRLSFEHLQSDGYRANSAMHKDEIMWESFNHLKNGMQFNISFLYAHIFYQTPGALTFKEFMNNPKAARPSVGAVPGSEQNKTAITQDNILGGLELIKNLGKNFINSSQVYFSGTAFVNPTIRNYSKNNEPHAGARTTFTWHKQTDLASYKFDFGGEYQQDFDRDEVYQNNSGTKGTLQTNDAIYTGQRFAFIQATAEIKSWIFTSGLSISGETIQFHHLFPQGNDQQKTFGTIYAPRFAILKKLGLISIYASYSTGFSPPAASELLPSGSKINTNLQSEDGINYETGIKGNIHKISFDISGFAFSRKHSIVQRRDSAGGDFYINAGGTRQHGIEALFNIPMLQKYSGFNQSFLRINYAFHPFYYDNFIQLSSDFSGNRLPGEPLHNISAQLNIEKSNGVSLAFTWFYNSEVALNDAGSAQAQPYNLLGIKLGYTISNHLKQWLLSTGIDNLLNTQYSLGSDFNAAGGRYYNAAAGRNFYVAIQYKIAKDIKK